MDMTPPSAFTGAASTNQPSTGAAPGALRRIPTSAELQDLWFVQSTSMGWAFAADWHDPAVEAVCEASVSGFGIWPAAERLGAVRARSGASLGETLTDIDALTTVLPAVDAQLVQRAVALGWAGHMTVPTPSIFDPLTGLVSAEYLRTRIGEVYRAAEVADERVSATHALVVVRVDLTGRRGWDRLTPLILAGDAMRTVFDGGQSLARLADHVAAALCSREEMLPRRAELLRGLVTERLVRIDRPRDLGESDPTGLGRAGPPQAGCDRGVLDEPPARSSAAAPRVWVEALPDAARPANDLIGFLGR